MELTLQSAKTIKGEKKGYLTGILYMSAASSSGITDLCPYSSPECEMTCLGHTAGRMVMPTIQAAQLRRTKLYVNNYKGFITTIEKDIHSVINQAANKELTPCFRLNGTSDQPKLAWHFAKKFPKLQFYDYTKIPEPWKRVRDNYHLTFSLSELNLEDAIKTLDHKINVAVVFNVHKDKPLPETWRGYKVINGDETDLRFLDPKGVVVGLHAKGKAKHLVPGGFVQIAGWNL